MDADLSRKVRPGIFCLVPACLALLLSCAGGTQTQAQSQGERRAESQAQNQEQQQYLKFAVLALTDSEDARREFENQLVIRLREDQFDATASFQLLPEVENLDPTQLRSRLLASDIQALLILRPLEIPEDEPVSPELLQMSQGEFTSVARFVQGYRGADFDLRTIVHIAGFLLQQDASRLFWHGVIWLDDTVETEQNRIDRIVDLVQFNLANSRSALRAQLGLPPLSGNQ